MEQRVVCAANKLDDGTVILGARHWDDFMHQQMDMILKTSLDEEINFIRNHQQGFIDQYGNFLTREEAWIIAEKNGQIVRDHDKCVGELFSEHLY